MKLEYDAESGTWLLNGWSFEKRGGGSFINYWTAEKGEKWFWAKTRKQAIEFAKIIDNGGQIEKLFLSSLY
jgi:hypothetical protein